MIDSDQMPAIAIPRQSLAAVVLSEAVAGPVVFDPISLFALGEAGVLYLNDDITKYWQDSARTVAGVVGQPVGAWDDVSGNADHATQATGAAKPTLRQSGSFYYLEYDGVDDALSGAIAILTDFEMAAAVEPTSFAATRMIFNQANAGTVGAWTRHLITSGGTDVKLLPDSCPTGLNAVAATAVVFGGRSSAAGVIGSLNTVDTAATARTTPAPSTNGLFAIGKRQYNASDFYLGKIFNLFVRDEVLTADDRLALRTYLAARSGVTL